MVRMTTQLTLLAQTTVIARCEIVIYIEMVLVMTLTLQFMLKTGHNRNVMESHQATQYKKYTSRITGHWSGHTRVLTDALCSIVLVTGVRYAKDLSVSVG